MKNSGNIFVIFLNIVRRDWFSVHKDFTLSRKVESAHQLNECRFTCTVQTDDGNLFTAMNLERNVFDRILIFALIRKAHTAKFNFRCIFRKRYAFSVIKFVLIVYKITKIRNTERLAVHRVIGIDNPPKIMRILTDQSKIENKFRGGKSARCYLINQNTVSQAVTQKCQRCREKFGKKRTLLTFFAPLHALTKKLVIHIVKPTGNPIQTHILCRAKIAQLS